MANESQSLPGKERRLEDLFNAAHRDPELKRKLLANPAQVAEEWGVRLGEADVERLTKLGAFAELAQEARAGSLFRPCDPRVCYPSTVWLRQEVIDLLKDFIIFYPGPIGYPIDTGVGTATQLRTLRRPISYIGPIGYPWESGVGGGGQVRPWRGPIFYPASLRILIEEKLNRTLGRTRQ